MTPGSPLPRALYRADEVRALDACAIGKFGIPGMTLMERAGQAAFGIIQRRWPRAQRIVVFCGGGNNGGDGYVVASLARRAGKDVTVVHVGARDALRGDARTAMEQAVAARVPMVDALDPAVQPDRDMLGGPVDLVVDALLGTGLRTPVRADYLGAIETLNASGAPVLAIDLPSGLCADSGIQFGSAVRADATVTFIGLKRGLFTGRGPALCGDVYFDDLRVPPAVQEQVAAQAERLDASLVDELLAPRARDAHKGRFGHVLVIGGDHGFAGAALLAAEAAARSGAGLVSVATRPEHVTAFVTRRPELMVRAVTQPAALEPLLARATVAVVGPGLGTEAWGRSLLACALQSRLPLVLDADALNLIAAGAPDAFAARRRDPQWVLTPHPGEAGRLLGVDSAAIQADRFRRVRELQSRFGGTVLLKGAGTLIDSGDGRPVSVAAVGNPGMASGGMGDVLSGVIGALLAQGLSPADAARLGAVVHGAAADRCAARHGERGLLAGDLFEPLRELLNGRR
ncbi:MAG: NAD(P)H-hydrate dehydratase [Pseudomonadota bacterium]